MDVRDLFRSLFRRPLAVAVVVAFVIAAAVLGWHSANTSNQSSAVVVVIPPGAGNPDAGLNPFINLNNNIAQLATVLASVMQSGPAMAAVEATGASGDYTVSSITDDHSSSPQLSTQVQVAVTGPDADTSLAGANALLDFADGQLHDIQTHAGVPASSLAQMVVSVEPEQGVPLARNAVRAAGAYAVAAALAGLLLLILLDGAIRLGTASRRRHATPGKRGQPVAAIVEESTEDVPDPGRPTNGSVPEHTSS